MQFISIKRVFYYSKIFYSNLCELKGNIYQLIYLRCQEHLQEHTGKKIGFITILLKQY